MEIKPIDVLLILSISLVLCSCMKRSEMTDSRKYFEGEIKFHVSSKSLDNEISDKIIQRILGEIMIGVVKEDYYKTISINKHGDSILMYHDLVELKLYYDDRNNDTIFWYPLDDPPGELIGFAHNEKPKKKILGKERESITIRYLPDDPYINEFEGTYYFHPDYYLNKSIYENHKQSFWNVYVGETGAISIRNEIIAKPLYSAVYEAVDIQERKVLEKELEMDKNKILAKGIVY